MWKWRGRTHTLSKKRQNREHGHKLVPKGVTGLFYTVQIRQLSLISFLKIGTCLVCDEVKVVGSKVEADGALAVAIPAGMQPKLGARGNRCHVPFSTTPPPIWRLRCARAAALGSSLPPVPPPSVPHVVLGAVEPSRDDDEVWVERPGTMSTIKSTL